MTNGMFYQDPDAKKVAFRAFCNTRRCETDGCEAFTQFQDISEKHGLNNPNCKDVWEHLTATVSANEGEKK